MATINSFPNNSDEYIGAEPVMKWLHGRTSGVWPGDQNLSVAPVSGSYAITVSDGVGWIANEAADGVVFWNDTEITSNSKLILTPAISDPVYSRVDRVVVSWETTDYVAKPTIDILQGTASSSPSAPALTNNNVMRQISIARISIPAGSTSITSDMITDERMDESVCGLVTDSVGIDTSVMQAQFSALLQQIQEELAELHDGTDVMTKTVYVNEGGDGVVLKAKTAETAQTAQTAVNAQNAQTAQTAVNAQSAQTAQTANSATTATKADSTAYVKIPTNAGDHYLEFRATGDESSESIAILMDNDTSKSFVVFNLSTGKATIVGTSEYAERLNLGGHTFRARWAAAPSGSGSVIYFDVDDETSTGGQDVYVAKAYQANVANVAGASETSRFYLNSAFTTSNSAYTYFDGSQAFELHVRDQRLDWLASGGYWYLYPSTDALHNLGTQQNRWRQLYASIGTISTSDRNQKEQITILDGEEKWLKLLQALKPVHYKLKDTDDTTHDRVHVGFIAQDVEETMNSLGMTAMDFAALCIDPEYTKPECDENGNTIKPAQPIEGTKRYGLRYEEFIPINTLGLQHALARIAQLEERVAQLEALVNKSETIQQTDKE